MQPYRPLQFQTKSRLRISSWISSATPPNAGAGEDGAAEASPTERLIAAQSSALLDALALLDEAGEVRPLEEVESELIRYAITHYRGQMSEVARRLRIGRSTLYRKLETLGLDRRAGRIG